MSIMIFRAVQYSVIAAMLALPLRLAASDGVRTVSARLQAATVFLQGAELTHTANVRLEQGENEVLVEGLSPVIDEGSLKISITGGVTVASHAFSKDYLTQTPSSAAVKRLQDSIDRYGRELEGLNMRLQINDELMKVLKANNSVGGTQNGLSVAELMRMMDYYEGKLVRLSDENGACTRRKAVVTEKIATFTQQRDLEKRKNDKISGRLHLKLIGQRAGESAFTIVYYTDRASWEPCYDLQMDGTDKPLRIVYKADIRQTTGLDWERVNLTLSTVTPSNGKVAPLPQTWFLHYVSASAARQNANLAMQNSLSYQLAGATPGVAVDKNEEQAVLIRGTATLDASARPLYVVDGEVMTEADFQLIDPAAIKEVNVLKDAGASSIYGSRAANGVVVVTTKRGMDDYVVAAENEIDVSYKIELPYTVAGNGNPQNVMLRTVDAEADYSYYCVPKLDRGVFLTASIKNRERLNLLAGKASVTIEGSYTGTTYIDPSTTRTALELTLGQDGRMAVKREKMQDMSSVRFLGSDVRQEFAYRISVMNTRQTAVRMIVKDQYPLSTQKDITVENVKFTGNPYENKEVGTLTWEFELAPGKTEMFDLRYSVKYPKGRRLNL